MARLPGIELDEIYAKYELHPEIVDLYVEGEFDRDFLVQLFTARGLTNGVSVFTVNEVEVPNEEVAARGLPLGSNKWRVIALAYLLSERLVLLCHKRSLAL